MPDTRQCRLVGKSTYERLGLSVHITPLEPGWEGYVTLEFKNHTDWPIHLYPGMGTCSIGFFRLSDRPIRPYDGKYQNQENRVVLPRVATEEMNYG